MMLFAEVFLELEIVIPPARQLNHPSVFQTSVKYDPCAIALRFAADYAGIKPLLRSFRQNSTWSEQHQQTQSLFTQHQYSPKGALRYQHSPQGYDHARTTFQGLKDRWINEEELKGERAKYGKQVVQKIAEALVLGYGKGFEVKNLRRMMKLAGVFPDFEIVAPLVRQLSWSHFLARTMGSLYKHNHSYPPVFQTLLS
jgi:hypothetical protein